jgi:O-antigen/teichoic acid export membrane protein
MSEADPGEHCYTALVSTRDANSPHGENATPLARVLGYLPSAVIPGAVSFTFIFIFSRILDPESYGRYALASSAAFFAQVALFYWIQLGITRFHPRALVTGTVDQLLATAYACYSVGALGLLLVTAGLAAAWAPEGGVLPLLWLAAALALGRSLIDINLAVHGSNQAVLRYNVIEAGQHLVGLMLALMLVVQLGLGASGLIAGFAAGSALLVAADGVLIAGSLRRQRPDPTLARSLIRYGAPLAAAWAFSAALAVADRFLVGYFLDGEAVGHYAVAYGLVDRTVALVFVAATFGAFPLAVHALERAGAEAAREQMRKNAVIMLAIIVPAVVGFIVAGDHITAVVIGPEFRREVARLVPYLAVGTFLGGLATHYFSQAFLLTQRTHLFLMTLGPGLLVNLTLNALLIPSYGLLGAAIATLAAYFLVLVLSIVIGRRVFRLAFPFTQALRIAGATVVMAWAVAHCPAPMTAAGLAVRVGLGVAVYALAALVLDVGRWRSDLTLWLLK